MSATEGQKHSKDSAFQKPSAKLSGVTTGYAELDNLTGGLQPGSMYVVMGRYGMGHQTLTLNIASNVATLEEGPVLVLTLGEDPSPLRFEMICGGGRVWMNPDGTASVETEQDFQRMIDTKAVLAFGKMVIIETKGYKSAVELRESVSQVVQERGVKLVIVRNFQWLLAECWTPKGSDDEYELASDDHRDRSLAALSQALKSMARELEVPVVLNVDVRKGRYAPTMKDLEDFGYLESDADMVLSLHRDEKREPTEENWGVADVRVEKDRHGDRVRFQLAYVRQYRRFENFMQQPVPQV